MQTICYNMYKLGVQMDVGGGGGGKTEKSRKLSLRGGPPRESEEGAISDRS